MTEHLFALLVHNQSDSFESLKRTLKDLSVETYSVTTCKEASALIPQCRPHMIFTDKSLADGSWASILDIADSGDVSPSVIVVAAHPDTRLYVSVMERGAFDFVAPPFEHEPLSFVTRSAALYTQRRRNAQVHAGTA